MVNSPPSMYGSLRSSTLTKLRTSTLMSASTGGMLYPRHPPCKASARSMNFGLRMNSMRYACRLHTDGVFMAIATAL